MHSRWRLDIAPNIGWAVSATAFTALSIAAVVDSVTSATNGSDDRAPVARIVIAAAATALGFAAAGAAIQRMLGRPQRYPLIDGAPLTVAALVLLILWSFVVSVTGQL